MTTTSTQGWKEWLNTHATRPVYDSNFDKVTKLCTGITDNQAKFEKLTNNKNLVVLSRAPLGKKCQATFYHSVVGVPITPDDLHYVAISGMDFGTGVELHPDSFFSASTAQYVPEVLGLIKVKNLRRMSRTYLSRHQEPRRK